jgi:hypothetical protein
VCIGIRVGGGGNPNIHSYCQGCIHTQNTLCRLFLQYHFVLTFVRTKNEEKREKRPRPALSGARTRPRVSQPDRLSILRDSVLAMSRTLVHLARSDTRLAGDGDGDGLPKPYVVDHPKKFLH